MKETEDSDKNETFEEAATSKKVKLDVTELESSSFLKFEPNVSKFDDCFNITSVFKS